MAGSAAKQSKRMEDLKPNSTDTPVCMQAGGDGWEKTLAPMWSYIVVHIGLVAKELGNRKVSLLLPAREIKAALLHKVKAVLDPLDAASKPGAVSIHVHRDSTMYPSLLCGDLRLYSWLPKQRSAPEAAVTAEA